MKTARLNTKVNFGLDKPVTKSDVIEPLKRKNLYWISQTSGWSLFVIINLLIISSFETIPLKQDCTVDIIGNFGNNFFSFLSSIYQKK